MTKHIKCCRKSCQHTSKDPKANDWLRVDEAPPELKKWIGNWMCRSCFNEVTAILEAHGSERMIEQ